MLKQSLNKTKLTNLIRRKAADEGFFACGIAPVHALYTDKKNLDKWLANEHHGHMKYMEKKGDIRTNARKLLPGAHSVISLLLIYSTPYRQVRKDIRISKYAYGKDYHDLVKKKLDNIIDYMSGLLTGFTARSCVDSSPVFEKRWAEQAGLGWRGKHTLIINPEAGSYFFLGEIITNLILDYDKSIYNQCGNCKKCIDACPTGAIIKPYHLDARKCIAYLTIENRGEFDKDTPADFGNYIFGCDICQDVCPWNQRTAMSIERLPELNLPLLRLSPEKWLNLTKEEFNFLTKNSCVRRTGLAAMKRNVAHVMKHIDDNSDTPRE